MEMPIVMHGNGNGNGKVRYGGEEEEAAGRVAQFAMGAFKSRAFVCF